MHTATAQSQARPHSHQHAGQRAPAAAQSAPAAQPKRYNPRHPERTLLYRTISENFETWLDLACAGQFDGQGDHHTPRTNVRQAFRKYLECGIFVNGFARARCGDCGHDYFVAFSCKGRGVCPSCNTRRMAETAATDKAALHIGAVAFIHRFGSSLNEHVHFHVCVVDGVFETTLMASIQLFCQLLCDGIRQRPFHVDYLCSMQSTRGYAYVVKRTEKALPSRESYRQSIFELSPERVCSISNTGETDDPSINKGPR